MIDLKTYIVDFDQINWDWLPMDERNEPNYAWMQVFTSPIKWMYKRKQQFREDIRYRLQHNGQVIYLEKVLNEYYHIPRYNPLQHQDTKRIYIGGSPRKIATYLYTAKEQKPVYVYQSSEQKPIYLYTSKEVEESIPKFTVWVPATLVYIESEMRALIDYYIDTRIYTIKTYK